MSRKPQRVRFICLLLGLAFAVGFVAAGHAQDEARGVGARVSRPDVPRTEIPGTAHGLPRDALLLAPIPGWTSAAHLAPRELSVPLGVPVRFLRAAHSGIELTWLGLREIARDGRWAMAELAAAEPGRYEVGVHYRLANGQTFEHTSLVEVVAATEDVRPLAIRVSAAPDPTPDAARSSTATRRGDGVRHLGGEHFIASRGALLELSVRTRPRGFESLVEWWIDGRPRLELGSALPARFDDVGTHYVAATLGAGRSIATVETEELPDDDEGAVPETPWIDEAFTSTADVRISLDVDDPDCQNVHDLSLTSTGLDPTLIRRPPPPYEDGGTIVAEMLMLELGAFDSTFGRVFLRERESMVSFANVTNVSAPAGEFESGWSTVDVFIKVELPDLGFTFDTGGQPIHLEAGLVTELPPFGTAYEPVEPEPVPLYDQESGEQAGWICHASHIPQTPTTPYDPYDPPPRDEDWFQSDGQTTITVSTPALATALSRTPMGRMMAGVLGAAAVQEEMTLTIDLTSQGFMDAEVLLDPAPYQTGDVIETEMVRLELGGFTAEAGEVIVRERQDLKSRGLITDVVADADGNFVSGSSTFELFLEIEVPSLGLVMHTGMDPVLVSAGSITGLPPVGGGLYEHDEDDAQTNLLFDAYTFQQAGQIWSGNHWPTQETDCCYVDLDIDSDNTNGVADPDRSQFEDMIETSPPGKYIGLNDDDDDNNKVRDLAEEPIRFNPPENDPVPMILELYPNTDPGYWRLSYPQQVEVYDMQTQPPSIIPSGTVFPTPLQPNPKRVMVEGVQTSSVLGDVSMTLDYDCDGDQGFEKSDTVVATVVKLDLDVDSDNSQANPDFPPDRDAGEDDIEDHDDKPGRYVFVNDDDDDNDGVVDSADGYNLDGTTPNNDDANAQENDFVRLVLEVPAPVDLYAASIKVEYDASDPASATATGNLRIWTKNGNAVRKKARIDQNGDYVAPATYAAGNLGLSAGARTVDLWIEGIRANDPPSSERIVFSLDPDGPQGPAVFVHADAVRVTVYDLDLDVDTDRDGSVENADDDADEDKWSATRGAIIRVNNDDDNDDDVPDNRYLDAANADNVVNGVKDRDDLAPLDLQQGAPPAGHSLWLRIKTADEKRLRIFDDRTNAADQEVLGPSTGTANGVYKEVLVPAALISAGRLQYGVEAIRPPADPFDGELVIELVLRKGAVVTGAVVLRDVVRLQVTPFLMLPNTATAETLYMEDWMGAEAFETQVIAAVGAANVRKANVGDRWPQDEWEIGFCTVPNGAGQTVLPTILDLPRDRTLDGWGKANLMGPVPDAAGTTPPSRRFHLEDVVPTVASKLLYGGNLELAPPYDGFDYGRVVYGRMAGQLDDEVRKILRGAKLQAKKVGAAYQLIEPDTGWLDIAHIDEYLAFIPSNMNNAKNAPWKLAVADPATATTLMQGLDAEATGTATAGAASTLTHATATWTANQWAKGVILLTAGTGSGQTRLVQSNTATVVTIYGTWTANPAADTQYRLIPATAFAAMNRPLTAIEDHGVVTAAGASTLTDGNRGGTGHATWTAGDFTPGGVVRIVAGTGAGQMRDVSANTANTLTVTNPWAPALDATSVYVVLSKSMLWRGGLRNAVVTVFDLLHNTAGTLELGQSGADTTLDGLLAKQTLIQAKINAGVGMVQNEVGLGAGDLVKLPLWYRAELNGPAIAQRTSGAYWPGSANLQVWNTTVLVPEPFGPKNASGQDVFKKDIQDKLAALGLAVHFIDTWDEYHVNKGEVHCGTNVRRTPPAGMQKWWEDWPDD